jgi:hypothetical protein
VPSDVKAAFDKAFAGENKSAVLTGLMRQAVEEQKRQRRRARAIDQILRLGERLRPVSDKEIRAARVKGRP